ncbi:uncharacterized protein F5147DRAFT_741689 [Suillus discolor]|uniref:DUF659 domain-containing protein n=1 Tax=Suillus discolor TaxID=1912936 RepID=A0A9P7K230_9AGAM|nr:uncharacterized protein F5147DRAFT_741689 [Suillus discolor]KAG2120772.1 hypothetical protein F5147DRAFT_741689 [Suillus discolor]
MSQSNFFAATARQWVSPVYAFFHPTPNIVEIGGWRAHEFKCQAKGCKAKVQCFLDKEDVLQAANQAKDANEVRKKIVSSFLRNGSITASFECKGKGKVTYSHRQHTRAETNLRPFEIVKDKGFQSLMKTGRPEYYILSPSTVARDVQMRIAGMIKGYPGKVNFTTDGWTSPNHRAFVAVSVHLKLNGKPLTLPLDIIEVAKLIESQSHTGEELAQTFADILEEYGISEKVSQLLG